MRYTTKQYAASLIDSLGKKTGEERAKIVRKFLALLQRKGDYARRKQIFEGAEREHLKRNSISKVDVELASEPSASLEKDIETALKKKIILNIKKAPEILGGIRILIDDEILIDASARTQVERLFPNKT